MSKIMQRIACKVATFLAQTSVCSAVMLTVGCGGTTDSPPVVEPPMAALPVADAGADITLDDAAVVQLDASASSPAEQFQGELAFQWRQLSGPTVQFLTAADAQSPQPYIVVPATSQPSVVELELTVKQGAETTSDTVNISLASCEQPAGEVFGDCISAGFGPLTAYESDPEQGEVHHYQGAGDYHVQWRKVDTGHAEHEQALEVTWNANDPDHQRATNGWFGIGAGEFGVNNGVDLSDYAQGTLSFDMRLIHHEQPGNPTPLVVKMECGWPCSSAEMPIAGAESSYEWQTYSYSIARMIDTGLDITNVTFPLIVQPLWRQQEQTVTVQIDNVRLSEEYSPPPGQEGCPSAGAISYTLARSANPNADEQDAYQRITQAMDEAVRQYNCYTNLQRVLRVSYNPDVATADGSTNGSIRFGSRASMHHVTAMHEISHVLGVGAGAFRNLVRDGVYSGSAGTAAVRAISGVPDDVIKSDGTHFWPHGLNYISEGQTQEDLINHCVVVEAIVQDL